jgi:MoxR-like ATPase
MVKLLKASAFLNGSDTIRLSDCTLLSYCLWSEMDQMEAAEEMVNAAIQKSAEGYLLNIKGLEQDIEELKDRQSSEHSLREVNDPGIQVIDTYYYQVEGVRMKERLLIFAADYQHLDQTGKLFYLHKDKYKANCCILKKYDSILHAKVPRNKIYTLKKGLRSIYINNYEYHLMCYEDCPHRRPNPSRRISEPNINRWPKRWTEWRRIGPGCWMRKRNIMRSICFSAKGSGLPCGGCFATRRIP